MVHRLRFFLLPGFVSSKAGESHDDGKPFTGRRCLITAGGLPAAGSSSASRRCSLWYRIPAGARKRGKIGDRGAETRRFRWDYLFHRSIINIIFVLSPRNLLPVRALLSLRSQTRSSWLPCRFLLCLFTQRSEAFSSSFSLNILEQIDQVASTVLHMTDVPWNKLAGRSVRLKVPGTWPYEQHVKHLQAFPW